MGRAINENMEELYRVHGDKLIVFKPSLQLNEALLQRVSEASVVVDGTK